MLYIFTPFIFTRNQQIIKVKQKDHISSMSSIGLAFSQLGHVNTRLEKLESQFLHFPSSRYAFYKIETNLKALIQLNLIPLEKYLKQQVSYFYQIVHFIKNPTKFGSPHLDTPNSKHDFCKFATKSRKTNKEKINLKSGPAARCTQSSAPEGTDSGGPQVNDPTRQRHRSRARRLTDDNSPTARSPGLD